MPNQGNNRRPDEPQIFPQDPLRSGQQNPSMPDNRITRLDSDEELLEKQDDGQVQSELSEDDRRRQNQDDSVDRGQQVDDELS